MGEEINVGLVGPGFMGRAHSNAWIDVSFCFEKLARKPVLKCLCGRTPAALAAMAAKYGWLSTETDWKRVVQRDDIDLVDICTANDTHMAIALAAAKRGKHILCEKPIAMSAKEARRMRDAAREAGVRNMVAFNYRRVPAIALAKKMISEGKIGKIHHFNAVYYQDWLVDPKFPLVWRHDARTAGSGAHGDMNAHIVDLARHLVGEIDSVSAAREIFVKERPLAGGRGKGPVTADDAMCFMARFREGALGSFLATRFATGRKNFLRLEIFGSKGSLGFNLERLNELEYFSNADPAAERGFRNILVTESEHPYLLAWWPPGHIIGWEHTFIHEVADLLEAIDKKRDVFPDFHDGMKCQQTLDAVMKSADNSKWVQVSSDGDE